MRGTTASFLCALAGMILMWGCDDATVAPADEKNDTTQVVTTDTTKDSDRPTGWTKATHGKSATPNYDSLFPQNQVQALVLELTDSAYQAMWDDMTSILGTFGAGSPVGGPIGGGPGGVPIPDTGAMGFPGGPDSGFGGLQAAIDAAAGKQMGDSCVVAIGGMTLPGTVQSLNGMTLCAAGGVGGPDGGVGGPNVGLPDDALTEILSREPAYVPADMHLGGHTWWKVGVRPKGNSSLSQAWQSGSKKLPFRLDIDRFEDAHPGLKNQRVWGFGKLSLHSGAMDASLIRERLASDVFRDAGVPTTRETFVQVLLKHGNLIDTLGLYTLVEVPDEPFLDQAFESHSGNLYKPEGTGARFATWVDSTFLVDADDISDVRAFYYALHSDRSDTAAWRAKVEASFNVDGFLRWLAVNTLIRNWDTYGQMAHNYYLYSDKGRLQWIPWDLGLAFQSNQGGASVWLGTVDSTWPLIDLFLRDSKYRAAYRAELESALGGAFETSKVLAKIGAWKDLLEPYLTATEKGTFATEITKVESFVRDRATQVQAELAGANPGATPIEDPSATPFEVP
jgi:spore coat protein H